MSEECEACGLPLHECGHCSDCDATDEHECGEVSELKQALAAERAKVAARDAALAEARADIEEILSECRVMGGEIEACGSTWVPEPYINYAWWKRYQMVRRALEGEEAKQK